MIGSGGAKADSHYGLSDIATFASIATRSRQPGARSKERLQPGDTRLLAKTPTLGGQETATVTFPVAALTAGQPYTCFFAFPAHAAQMRGMLVVGGELGHPHVHIDGLIKPA
ncbi:azurin [Bordetella trematum]|nr:azurin [Bordetella trematum]